MSNPLQLTVSVEDRGAEAPMTVAVAGELDFGTTSQLLDVVEPLTATGRSLVLDLAEVPFCDSSALGALVHLHKAAVAAGGSLCLVGLCPQVAMTITVSSLNRLLVISDAGSAVVDGGSR